MMNLSSRFLPLFGLPLIATLFVVGCSQGSSPSVAPSAVTAPTSVPAAPPPYDAGGPWHASFVITSMSGEELLSGEGDLTFTQDSDGNLHGVNPEEGTQITLLRRGKGLGAKVTYDMSLFEPSSSGCPEDMSGVGQIDVATNTLTASLIGVLEGCQNNKVVLSITATKNGV
jgi:hypothetical protein